MLIYLTMWKKTMKKHSLATLININKILTKSLHIIICKDLVFRLHATVQYT
jgi:hypothetical protein